mmetsp:Transcript_11590/g.25985  ORF Transcript_11590/g.25985 Transcript_11590/m.25985 type:complete len:120 (+) Transcript_11590:107-466(+)
MSNPTEDMPCITFTYSGEADHSVALVGCFNSWNGERDMLTKNPDGKWEVTKALPPGRYEYKFLVDGERFVEDTNAAERDMDGFGGSHSVITVGNDVGLDLDDTAGKLVVQHDRGVAYSQ